MQLESKNKFSLLHYMQRMVNSIFIKKLDS